MLHLRSCLHTGDADNPMIGEQTSSLEAVGAMTNRRVRYGVARSASSGVNGWSSIFDRDRTLRMKQAALNLIPTAANSVLGKLPWISAGASTYFERVSEAIPEKAKVPGLAWRWPIVLNHDVFRWLPSTGHNSAY
eukprot:Gregarina_sp_Poly_1__2870@NODE_17_length_22522_cov_92_073614_g15_i0_p14_GENE_NODE_17_length_22522_cov_92_073614_g15_i0NODE_17_length_22522_cov_92_073614_g15_i0_p14_ORF_typecomplete_len135_score6_05_NODE_17_length_22522_cov_92_073614_g15_i065766980